MEKNVIRRISFFYFFELKLARGLWAVLHGRRRGMGNTSIAIALIYYAANERTEFGISSP